MSDPEKSRQPGQHEVFVDEWLQLQGNGTLRTSSLATCIGVSIYSPAEAQAFLGHFNIDSMAEDGSFNTMLQAASSSLFELPTSRIWVGGGELIQAGSRDYGYDEEVTRIANDETLAFRQLVLEKLSAFGAQGAEIKETWLDTPSFVNYALDVGTGKEEIAIVEE